MMSWRSVSTGTCLMASTWISVIVSKMQCNEHLICTNLFALFMHCLVHRTIASLSKLTDDVKHLKYYNILTVTCLMDASGLIQARAEILYKYKYVHCQRRVRESLEYRSDIGNAKINVHTSQYPSSLLQTLFSVPVLVVIVQDPPACLHKDPRLIT